MEELFYCCECQSLCNTTIIDKKQTLTIKGREITLMAPVRECTTCGEEILDEEIENLIAERQNARKAKDFARADEIRGLLLEKGIELKDTREGVKWKRI